MLIEPQQSTSPPTPQLGMSQGMVSSPSPQHTYDVVERMKKRVGNYRVHHQITFEKNQKTVDAQNMKMKTETNRLQQQFLNNSQNNSNTNNKSKQQKSVNTSAAQRNANKRSNSMANNTNSEPKSDSMDTKPSKVAKVANNRNSANSSAKGSLSSPNNPSFRNNCAKIGSNPQSLQIDIKMKTSFDGSGISNTNQPSLHSNPSMNSMPEIKREIEDNSYFPNFQNVNVEAIHDFLKDNTPTINGFNPNNFDAIDEIKDIINDPNLFPDDGFGPTYDGFGEEDFIKKFLEEINDSNFNDIANNFGQHLNSTTFRSQQPVVNNANHMINDNNSNNGNNGNNCNISGNLLLNSNLNANNMTINQNPINSNNFMTNSMQTPNNEMTSYHPIQPRLQPNLMSNIPNRSSVQIMNSNSQTIAINGNNTIRYVNTGNTGPQQGQTSQLLLQQIPTNGLSQQQLNNPNMSSQPSQTSHPLLQQQTNSQQIHLRLANNPSMQQIGVVSVVPKTEDVSVQLSIQVPQQTNQMIPNQTSSQSQQTTAQSVAAAAKLKQMAQKVQQNTHQWVINHSNPTIQQQNQNTIQTINQQMSQQIRPQTQQTIVSTQRIPIQTQQRQQPQQVLSPDIQTQTPNQIQIQIQQQNTNQNFFNPQMNQQMYWQHNQHNQHNQQQQHQQQIQQTLPQHQQQTQSQPQQTQTQQLMQQNIQQNQQNFQNYWSHPSQMGQMGGQTTQQQQQQQQTQHYFNSNQNNNYNYF